MLNNITGSIQVKSGKYYAVVNLKAENGKRIQKWICLNLAEKGNKRAAERALSEILSAYSRGEQPEEETRKDIKMWQLMEMWLQSCELSLRESTVANYATTTRAHIIPYFKKLNISAKDVKPYHIEKYYCEKLQTLSPQTVQKHHANISAAFEYGIKNGFVSTNAARLVKVKRGTKKKIDNVYDLDEIKALKMAVKGSSIEVPVYLIAQLGLRRSEVLGLKWDAIDFGNKEIKICATVVNVGATATFSETTKSESSRRTLPMSESMANYLRGVYKSQREAFGKIDDWYVCVGADGEPIKPDYLTRHFKIELEKAGLRVIRLHDLRHSAATNLLAAGVPMNAVSEWLGHSDIYITVNTYGHVLDGQKKQIARMLSED